MFLMSLCSDDKFVISGERDTIIPKLLASLFIKIDTNINKKAVPSQRNREMSIHPITL